MKYIILAAALLAMCGTANAQTTTSKSKNNASAGADAAVILMPGAITPMGAAAGAAAASATSNNGWNQPQLVMNTAAAPSTSTFNDCGIAWSAGLWLLSGSRTSESEECKLQRQAIFAAQHLHSIPIAFESMCGIPSFRDAVARTNEPQCAQTIAERNKNDRTAQQQSLVRAAEVRPAQVSLNDIPPSEACFGADGRVTGRIVNGICR